MNILPKANWIKAIIIIIIIIIGEGGRERPRIKGDINLIKISQINPIHMIHKWLNIYH